MNNNYPSWDAESWLQKFEYSKSFVGGTRPVRADVFQSTLKIARCGKYISSTGKEIALDEIWNKYPLKDNVFCEKEISLKYDGQKYDTQIKVVKQDCLDYAHELITQDPTDDLCVLNMASARNPGGGVYGGAGAQEEYLFRCSDYFRFLFQYANPPRHMAQLFKQVFEEPEFKGIYREIHFAIIEDHNSKGQNYNAFNETLAV